METHAVYNIDTSLLIYLERYYPRADFLLIWENLEKAFERGDVYIIDYVWREIQAFHDQEDPLVEWIKDRKSKLVRKVEDRHVLKASEIIRENPEIVKDNVSVGSVVKENADPYVIAHSLVENTIVITGETKYINPTPSKIRIPHVCEKCNVPCVSSKPGEQDAIIALHLIQTLNLNKDF